jgi:hypothetical protein
MFTENVLLHGAGPDPPGQTSAVAKFPGAKLALTFSAEFMVTVQVGFDAELAHAPPQLTNVDPPLAFAVSVTCAPFA